MGGARVPETEVGSAGMEIGKEADEGNDMIACSPNHMWAQREDLKRKCSLAQSRTGRLKISKHMAVVCFVEKAQDLETSQPKDCLEIFFC